MASGDLLDIPAVTVPGLANVPALTRVTGNSSEAFWTYAFDHTTQETIDFTGVMTEGYAGADIDVCIPFSMESDASNNVHVEIAWRRLDSAEDIDTTSHTYTYQSATVAVPNAVGKNAAIEITFTQAQADSIAAGEPYILRVRRAPANVNDDANSSDMYLWYEGIRVKEA